MKVHLIGFNLSQSAFPLGLSYLKSYVEKFHKDVDVCIKEYSFGSKSKYDINKNLELSIANEILFSKPDLVGFSCYIWNIELVENICNMVKSVDKKIKILLGGVEINSTHVTNNVDYVINGEGEIALKELIDNFKGSRKLSEVHNLSYVKDNKIINNKCSIIENLDFIPSPFDTKGLDKKFAVVRFEASRGCAYECNYCYYGSKKYRKFSLKWLDKSLNDIFSKLDFKFLTILDATFNSDKKFMKNVLDIIKKNSKGKRFTLGIELKPELVDEEVIEILKSCDFKIKCELGIQSTDFDVLNKSKRPFNLEKAAKGIQFLDKTSISYKVDLMYGLPNDDFFKYLNSARFVLNNASRQKILPAHHFMLLSNTPFDNNKKDQKLQKLTKNSSIVLNSGNQDIKQLYLIKLFNDQLNSELKIK